MKKPTDALGCIIAYTRLTPEPFSPCDVIAWAAGLGVGFEDQRSWGPVFSTAKREGYIRRAGLFSRESSNLSLRPGWVRV